MVKRRWQEKMREGVKPSVLLRGVLIEEPNIGDLDLLTIFEEEFDELPNQVSIINVLWNWNRTEDPNERGIGDDQLNDLLLDRLKGVI